MKRGRLLPLQFPFLEQNFKDVNFFFVCVFGDQNYRTSYTFIKEYFYKFSSKLNAKLQEFVHNHSQNENLSGYVSSTHLT